MTSQWSRRAVLADVSTLAPSIIVKPWPAARLPKVHPVWKEKLVSKCWALLEAEVGKLG
jgi:hypothetical protein